MPTHWSSCSSRNVRSGANSFFPLLSRGFPDSGEQKEEGWQEGGKEEMGCSLDGERDREEKWRKTNSRLVSKAGCLCDKLIRPQSATLGPQLWPPGREQVQMECSGSGKTLFFGDTLIKEFDSRGDFIRD